MPYSRTYPILAGLLKEELERKLHNSRRIRCRDQSERGAIDIAVGLTELCMVEGIEEFRAPFQVDSFLDGRIFQQRDVPVIQSRRGEKSPPGGS